MRASDLNKAMQYIDDCYLDIADSPEKEILTMHKKKHISLALIAAIVALTALVGSACAVLYLRMEDAQVGQQHFTSSDGSAYSWNAMTVNGMKGSPSYEAAKEWFDFKRRFDPNNEKQNAYYAQLNPPQFDEAYSAYRPYAPEMVEELNRLCEKYRLKLLGSWQNTPEMTSLLQRVGIKSFLVSGSPAEIRFQNGSDDGNGNFSFAFELDVTGGEEPWSDYLAGLYRYSKKDFLNTFEWLVSLADDVTQWNYTTQSGSNVLIVQDSPYGGFFLCDTEDAVIMFSINSLKKLAEDESSPISRRQMERIADAFDFTIRPNA